MNTPEPASGRGTDAHDNPESPVESLTDEGMIEFAVSLDDFMDEEVLDSEGDIVGALACYWGSVSGRLVFLGIKVTGCESVRVVPGRRSQLDDRHACLRLAFNAADIESAPCLDCATELTPALEQSVYEHFHIRDPEPHDGLRYFGK